MYYVTIALIIQLCAAGRTSRTDKRQRAQWEHSTQKHSPTAPKKTQNTSLSDTLNIAHLDRHYKVLNRTAAVGPDVLYIGQLQGGKKKVSRYDCCVSAGVHIKTERTHPEWNVVSGRQNEERTIKEVLTVCVCVCVCVSQGQWGAVHVCSHLHYRDTSTWDMYLSQILN